MANIIRAIWYQLKKDSYMIYSSLLAVVIGVFLLADGGISTDNGGIFYIDMKHLYAVMMAALPILWASRICGGDYNNKTINYEMLAGHTRAESYFGRLLLSVLLILGVLSILILIPQVVVTIWHGYGRQVSFYWEMVELLAAVLLCVRIICYVNFCSVLLRNSYAAMFISYIGIGFSLFLVLIVREICDIKVVTDNMIGVVRLFDLMGESNYAPQVINGQEINVYKLAMRGREVAGTLIVSAAVSVFYILAGYGIVKKRDME